MKLPSNIYITAFVSFIVAVCLFVLLFGGLYVGFYVFAISAVAGLDGGISLAGGVGVGVLMFLIGIAMVISLWLYFRVRRKKNSD